MFSLYITRCALDTLQHGLLELVELCVHVALTNVRHQFQAHNQVAMLTSRKPVYSSVHSALFTSYIMSTLLLLHFYIAVYDDLTDL